MIAALCPALAPAQQDAPEGLLLPEQFGQCLARLETQALANGISAPTIERILPNVEPLERVIRADRSQPEFVQSFADYLGRRVTAQRVAAGRALYAEHRELLSELTARTGVPGQYLVAFWGLESNFGSVLGNVPVFDSLATLACDRRRSDYFATELIHALRIVDGGHADPEQMIGSWAGAMGQTQFMPSVFLRHAMDGDSDGRVDLWRSAPDALASAARFLESLGWVSGYRWGREVMLPEGFDYSHAGRAGARSLAQWRELGVMDTRANPVADLAMEAFLVVPAGSRGPAFLAYENFDVIMRWNRSENFAISVGHLADRIAGGGGLAQSPPDEPPLARRQLRALQSGLAGMGFDPGPADGILGAATRAAIRAYQRQAGLVADGFPTHELLARFGIE